jgi:prepilin-type processing-associated H-X9-DG protein
MHAVEHKGYFPLTGKLWLENAVAPSPANLNDSGMVRYDYFDYTSGGNLRPMPLAAALASYLGARNIRTDTNANLSADISAGVLRKVFTCPTDENNLDSRTEGVQINSNGTGAAFFQVQQWNSYLHNAEIFGWDTASSGSGSVDHLRARGLITTIRHPSETMAMCDGSPFGGIYEIYGHYANDTLGDAYAGVPAGHAGNTSSFDLLRHRARMNVLFVDGHATCLNIPKTPATSVGANDLTQVFLARDLH